MHSPQKPCLVSANPIIPTREPAQNYELSVHLNTEHAGPKSRAAVTKLRLPVHKVLGGWRYIPALLRPRSREPTNARSASLRSTFIFPSIKFLQPSTPVYTSTKRRPNIRNSKGGLILEGLLSGAFHHDWPSRRRVQEACKCD